MTLLHRLRFAARILAVLSAFHSLATVDVIAQTTPTATLTGRVQNGVAGSSLENARISIAGTNREVFTDAFGDYRLPSLPAGTVTVQVFYTGLEPQSASVTLGSGETVRRDFTLASVAASRGAQAGENVLKLEQFIVDSARDTNAASIAINEQRFAGNIKTVLHTDAMGDIIQNNLGEFVKYLPGVDVGTDQMNAVQIGLRGLPSGYTNIALDGDDVNAAGSAGPTRNTLLQAFSLNNASRVEIYKVPTPDMSAASLGGSINMVSRTAFEASRPEFRFKAYVNKNSHDLAFSKQPGGGDGDDQKKTFHYQPDFDFAYTVPVSKNFGFSINAVKNDQFGVARRINRTFNTTTTAANPFRATVSNPYLTTYQYNVFPVYEHRYTLGTRLDWKVSPLDTLSFIYSGNWLVQDYEQHNFILNTGTNPLSWGPDFTHGRPGSGVINVNNTARYVRVRNNIFRLNYRHIGPAWDVTGGVGYNFSDQTYRAISHRQFETSSARIQNATIDFDGFSDHRPGRISVRNATGEAIDPFDLDNFNFFLNGANGTRDNDSTAKSARVDVSRKFFTPRLTGALKSGVSTAEQYRARRTSSFNPVYVGADRIANNADDRVSLAPVDLLNRAMLDYHLPRHVQQPQFTSGRRAWEMWEQYPQLFDTNANRRVDLRADALNTEKITERIDALYLMADVSLLEGRLRLIAGARYERTTDDGRAVLQDNLAAYQRDAAGNFILDAQRRPIFVVAPAKTNRATLTIDEGVAEDQLVYKKLGSRLQKEYGDYYPSLNATYKITSDIQARLGLARTLGRPDFGNILGATNVNQIDFSPDSSASGSALGTITTRNPALIPWTANSLDVRLEYYSPGGGEISTGFYRKQIKNFFSNRTFLATPEFLDSIGLSEEFVAYQVSAPGNVNGIAHINGWEVNVSQPLSFFTRASYARYFRVFANTTLVRNKGPAEADFRGFTPKLINWGFTYNRRPIVFNGRWTLVGKKRVSTVAAGNLGAAGWNYQAERLRFDASIDVRLTKNYALYFTGRNIFNNRDQNEAYAIGSPRYVKYAAEGEYGVTMQFGVKGTF
jgi:iron complex outermembrane receptor protein